MKREPKFRRTVVKVVYMKDSIGKEFIGIRANKGISLGLAAAIPINQVKAISNALAKYVKENM